MPGQILQTWLHMPEDPAMLAEPLQGHTHPQHHHLPVEKSCMKREAASYFILREPQREGYNLPKMTLSPVCLPAQTVVLTTRSKITANSQCETAKERAVPFL